MGNRHGGHGSCCRKRLAPLVFISFWVCCVVIVMNVLIAFLIDAYQAHVESIADSMQRRDRMARRDLTTVFIRVAFKHPGTV